MPDQNSIPVRLSVEEGRTVLAALAELPFKTVYELIGKMNHIANQGGCPGGQAPSPLIEYPLLPGEIRLIVKALGRMPFDTVYTVISRLDGILKERV